MLYPLHVLHDPGSAWCGEFPDFPGCFTAADDLQHLPAAAQEAVMAHYRFDDAPLPAPSAVEDWLHHPDHQGGFWMLVDIDLALVRPPRAIRLNISLPEDLVPQIDAAARQRQQSRSAFLAAIARAAIRA